MPYSTSALGITGLCHGLDEFVGSLRHLRPASQGLVPALGTVIQLLWFIQSERDMKPRCFDATANFLRVRIAFNPGFSIHSRRELGGWIHEPEMSVESDLTVCEEHLHLPLLPP